MDIHGVGANRPSYGLSWNTYDRLLTYGKKALPDGTATYDYSVLEPELATSWQIAPDGMSVAFTLRREAKFHDGTPVTAQDVKWSFDLGLATVSEPTALLVQEALDHIGIKTTINKIPGANWRGALLKKDMPLIINNFGGWLNYPEYFFFWCYHGQNAVFNTMSYQNAAMDKLIDEARFTSDAARYQELVRGFIGLAFDEVPRVALNQPYLDVAMQKNISGYQYWFHRQLDYRQLSKQ
jgi:ABC-type transport system substrate-binding protein